MAWLLGPPGSKVIPAGNQGLQRGEEEGGQQDRQAHMSADLGGRALTRQQASAPVLAPENGQEPSR